ncbi:ABC transporter permease [uncultured Ruminococcus sp.]|uniref:ABC transporter permease n=1 Tax=uncultured Ruminococcus sp. TaxID=165186 RepID=UPI0025EB66CA|nr:FtsX-like permease family protein [uncultured Ruminococcus sp.]
MLNNGEVYLPYKLKLLKEFKDMPVLTIKTNGGDESFKVKGFYEDVMMGATTMGDNRCIITDEDMDRLKAENLDHITDNNIKLLLVDEIQIKAENGLSQAELKTTLCRESALVRSSNWTVTGQAIADSIEMYSNVGTRTVFIFVVLLLSMILITMYNSISSSIDMEYTELGILKSQGFTIGQIRLVYVFQYTLALIVGSVLGILVSIPALAYLIGMWKNITGLMTETGVSFLKCGALCVVIILICLVFICIATSKINRISPVTAISGGRGDVHFDSRLNTRIRQRPLPFFLALRQLNSHRKSYIGTILIAALLVFFIVSIMILAKGLDTDNLFDDITGDISLSDTGGLKLDTADDIETEIRKIDSGAELKSESYHRMVINDELIAVHAYRSENDVFKPMEGRTPKYDNEIMITEIVSEETGCKIGDTLTVAYLDNEEEYVITGYFQTVWEFGMVCIITPEGMQRVGFNDIAQGYVVPSDTSKTDEILDMLNEKYETALTASEYEENATVKVYKKVVKIIMNSLIYAMYTVLLTFALVIVSMVSKRSFIRERTDIGIYKSMGFTVNTLRTQFSLRFALISLIGSGMGCILSILFSRKVLTYVLRIVGLTDFTVDYSLTTYITPAAILCLCFFIAAYAASRRIKTVEVRELITE